MSDSDRDNDTEIGARLRAENDGRKRKDREDFAEAFRDLQRVLPRHYLRGLTRVSFDSVLDILADYTIDKMDKKKETKRRTRILDRQNNELKELLEKIRDKLATDEKDEAKLLYQQHRHLILSKEDDYSTEDLSDYEEYDPNAQCIEVEIRIRMKKRKTENHFTRGSNNRHLV